MAFKCISCKYTQRFGQNSKSQVIFAEKISSWEENIRFHITHHSMGRSLNKEKRTATYITKSYQWRATAAFYNSFDHWQACFDITNLFKTRGSRTRGKSTRAIPRQCRAQHGGYRINFSDDGLHTTHAYVYTRGSTRVRFVKAAFLLPTPHPHPRLCPYWTRMTLPLWV